MKKLHSRKVLLFFLVLLFVSITIGCGSSTPNIAGLWEADFWNGAFIEFTPDLNFYIHEDYDSAENNDFYDSGIYRFAELNDQDCIFIGTVDEGGEPKVLTFEYVPLNKKAAAIEYDGDDHIILIKDDSCLMDESWVYIGEEMNLDKVNLRRVE